MEKLARLVLTIVLIAGFSMICKNAIALSPNVDNLGPDVNSPHSDFGPVVTADGNMLFFTSDRPGGMGGQDVWVSEWRDNKWTRPRNPGAPINTSANEGPDCVVEEDGRVYLYITYCKSVEQGFCDIYTSEMRSQDSWRKPVPLPSPIKSKYSDANASWDYVNNVLFFASTRKGGIPGEGPKRLPDEASYDIWMCPMNEDGSWGQAVNLGEPVNTSGWEGIAFYHPAEETLYFSSNGHQSMGGADIYKSKRIGFAEFAEPEPVSFVNTDDDDMYLSIPAGGEFAYFSSDTRGGLGKEDLYLIPLFDLLEPEIIALREMEMPPVKIPPVAKPPVEKPPVEKPPVERPPVERPVSKKPLPPKLAAIYFNLDKSELTPEAREKLDKAVSILKERREMSIKVAGHTCVLGSFDYNVLLSKQRAQAVVDYLENSGLDKDRIWMVYYGEERPAEPVDPVHGNPLNRRVEIYAR